MYYDYVYTYIERDIYILFCSFVYIEYFYISNISRGRTLLKVANRDTDAISVSLMGTLNSFCLIYSFEVTLLYFALDNNFFYSVSIF